MGKFTKKELPADIHGSQNTEKGRESALVVAIGMAISVHLRRCNDLFLSFPCPFLFALLAELQELEQ